MYPRLFTLLLAFHCTIAARAQEAPIAWTNQFNDNFFKVQQVGFSSDSKYLAVGHHKGNVVVYTADSGFVIADYKAHDKHVFCTKFRPGSTTIASGDKDGEIALYDYAAGKEVYHRQAHNKPITALYFTPDGKLLLTGSKDKTIKVWDAASGSLLHTLTYRKGNKIQSLYVDNDGRTVIAAIEGVNGGLRYLDMQNERETKNYDIGGNVEHFDVTPSGRYIAIGSLNRKIFLFDTKKLGVAATWKGHKRWVTDVSFNNTASVLFSGSNDNSVFAWSPNGRKHIRIYRTHRDIDAIKCSPDGKYLAVLATNEKIVVLDVSHVEAELK